MRCLHDPEAEIYHFYNLQRPFSEHFHEGLLLGCLLRGRRLLHLPDQEIVISPGQLIYLPPCTPHGCKPLDGLPVDWICLQVQPSAMASLPHGYLILDNAPMAAFLTAIAGEMDGSRLRAELHGLLEKIGDNAAMLKPFAERDAAIPQFVTGNKYKYLRTFRKACGITPGRYEESLRANRAKGLIRDGFSLCEAAAEFCDQSHLNRVFKKQTGVTPGAWRAAYTGGKIR